MTDKDKLLKASPRPWYFHSRDNAIYGADNYYNYGADNYLVAHDWSETKANAQLIIEAVNNYEGLLRVKEYACHKPSCSTRIGVPLGTKCDCGLEEALDTLGGET